MKELVALSSLPGMGPARLRALLEGRSPAEAWDVARRDDRWRATATAIVGTPGESLPAVLSVPEAAEDVRPVPSDDSGQRFLFD